MGGCAEHIHARGGRVSGEQAGCIDVLKKQCYLCAVCHGCDAAVAVIYGYMRGDGAGDAERR